MKKILPLLFFYCQIIGQPPVNTMGKFLDKNKVKTRISQPNYKFWNVYGNSSSAYEVPKGKGTNAMSANSIWIGGLDHNGAIHISANTYKQYDGGDWYTGPLDTINPATATTSNSAIYNKLWKIDCNDINSFVTAFNNGDVTAGTYSVPADILDYPAKGINNFQRNMAPFHDVNNNGIYDPQHEGDYPLIKGQQQILSVFNDSYSTHIESGGRALGLEVQERSYAYSDSTVADSMQAINYTTFYHYTIYNRSDTDYFQVHITDWADIDLGYYGNDYLGTDSLNDFAYGYNYGTDPNTTLSGPGYGTRLPVISIAMIQTDCLHDGIDNDGDGTTDETGEQFHMDKTSYYINDIGVTPQVVSSPFSVDNPDQGSPGEYYGYMTGFWKDNSPFTVGGMGYGGTVPASYIYPGDPSNNTGWTEGSVNNAAGDRRILVTSGPFKLPKRSRMEWEFAVVFSQDTTQNTNTISQFHSRVQRDVRNARYYDSTHRTPLCTPAVTYVVGIKENKQKELSALVYPNPANNQLTIELIERVTKAGISLSDVSGRIVKQKEITESDHTQFDISALDKGIYFISIESGTAQLVKKIIKN